MAVVLLDGLENSRVVVAAAHQQWAAHHQAPPLMAVMVVLVFGNVVMRYVFNSGITLSEELSRWLFVWLTFLGAVIAMHERTVDSN